jgi:lipopolysaccharide transport system permease protein
VTETQLRQAAPERVPPPARTAPVFNIRPAARRPHLDFGELWHYRELLFTFVWRDIKVRYKQSFLGIAWALLVPLFTTAVYVVIFGKFATFPAGGLQYQILVISGLLPMQYFTSGLTTSSTSLVSNVNLVKKVYFPRVLLPLAGVTVPLVDFVLSLVVLAGFMAWYNVGIPGIEVLLAPLFIGLAFLTALGVGFLLSALNVRYRDVPHALPVFVQVLPLISGVIFAVSEVPTKWQWILSFNPMTGVISGWRWAVVGGEAPDLGQLAVGVGVAIVLLLGGLAFFRASEPRFADTI